MHTWVIASLTVRDLLRRRILVLLFLFAMALILLAYTLRDLTIGQWQRLIADLGLGATDFSLTLIAVFIGATLVSGDLDRRTALPLLAKPISRSSYLAGRFVGLGAVIFGLCAVMVATTETMLAFAKEGGILGSLVQNTLTIGMGATLLGAVAILFSSITSTTLAAIATLTLGLGGHLTSNLEYFGNKMDSPLARGVMLGFVKVVPNLEAMNLKDFAAHAEVVSTHELVARMAYGAAYSAACLALASVAFWKRDLR